MVGSLSASSEAGVGVQADTVDIIIVRHGLSENNIIMADLLARRDLNDVQLKR